MSEVHNHVGSNTPFLRRHLVDYACSFGGHVIPLKSTVPWSCEKIKLLSQRNQKIQSIELKVIAVPGNVDPYYNVPPRGSFGPFGRYYLGEWSEDDNESRLTMRPEEEYVWPSPPPPPPYFAPFPHFSNENNVDPYYDVPPPNDFVPLSRYYPGEWMDVEHLSRFVRRPEEVHWTPPRCLPPPIAFPINSGIIVEESDEDIVLIQPSPNWVPNCNPKWMHGLLYVNHDPCAYHSNLPTAHLAPWIPDDSTDEEPYSTMHCCDCHAP